MTQDYPPDRRAPSAIPGLDDPFNDLWDFICHDTDDYGRKFRYRCADDERTWYLWNRWCIAILEYSDTPEFDGWQVSCYSATRLHLDQVDHASGKFVEAKSAADFVFDFSDNERRETLVNLGASGHKEVAR